MKKSNNPIKSEKLDYLRRRAEEALKKRTAELQKANAELKREIAEHKQADEALRESEEKYRILVENASDAIFIVQDDRIKFPNLRAREMIGYSEEELAKIPFSGLIHPEERTTVLENHERRLKGEELPGTYSFRVINRADEVLWVQLNTIFIMLEGRPATLKFMRDITSQKRLEAQFHHAQRMEAVGTLAGGIAHDVNNLLMGIQGHASLMRLDIDPGHPNYERLNNVEQSVKRGAELTSQLLGFARGGKYEVKPTGLNELIKHQNDMFSRTKKEITFHGKYEKNLWTVEVDQGQIEQVLLNIYINACQAMPGGGDLYIETKNATIDQSYRKPYLIEPGRYVKTSVTDTGVGMDEATQQRIFEPFFSTKEKGIGTGLGLASTYGIIKNHGGFINVYSEKGHGTTFNIYLPASEAESIEEGEPAETIYQGTETILLVDDEETIVDVGKEMMEKLGYEVLVAGSGREAIEIYKENKDKVDLVILDMIMPDLGGGETYDILKGLNPEIKALLSSGYAINGKASAILERGCNGFMQKPFGIGELSEKLRKILGMESGLPPQ